MPNNLFYGFKRFTCELLFWNFIFVVLVGIVVNASLWKISALAGIRAVARQASFGGGGCGLQIYLIKKLLPEIF